MVTALERAIDALGRWIDEHDAPAAAPGGVPAPPRPEPKPYDMQGFECVSGPIAVVSFDLSLDDFARECRERIWEPRRT
ncbi:MAG: hypothetical protein ACQGVC_18140 [Myxococcota bacterium]